MKFLFCVFAKLATRASTAEERETIYHVTVATRFKQTHVRFASHRSDKHTKEITKNKIKKN